MTAVADRLRVLIWHVHGSWMTAFVQGPHTYYVPVLPDRGPNGRGRAQTWDWPANVVEITPEAARCAEFDVVIVQRREELDDLVPAWTGREPGRDLRTIVLEHNAPQGRVADMRHWAADRDDVTLVHVTHFNDLFWDVGTTPRTVIEHGIVDPGDRYDGSLVRAVVAVNEPVRRGRVVGTDLLARFSTALPCDLFGIGVGALGGFENPTQAQLHREMPHRRVYLHPFRWTSLGLTLIEAMHLGMPVVALATTAALEAVPPEAGVISTDVGVLCNGLQRFARDALAARRAGAAARAYARERYGLQKFLRAWNALFAEVLV